MGGSSGGGRPRDRNGDGNTDDTTPAPQPDLQGYPNAPINRAFQPALPGGLERIAQQLGQGFGGQDMSQFISNLYQPMNIQQFQEPISQTQGNYDASKHTPISTGNEALDRLLMNSKKQTTSSSQDRDDN